MFYFFSILFQQKRIKIVINKMEVDNKNHEDFRILKINQTRKTEQICCF